MATTSSNEQVPKTIEELHEENDRLRQQVADLKHNVEVYRKLAFGPSSEKRHGNQAEGEHARQGHFFAEALLAEAKETAAAKNLDGVIFASPPKKPRGKGGRRSRFPDHVPTVTTEYKRREDDLECKCGSTLHEMGFETTKELERLELTFVHIIKRAKYGCRSCEQGVQTTLGPDRPFEKGLLGTGFLSYLINERFGNHMPYYRIEKKHAREGVDVSRSVLERSVARCAARLEPIYDLLVKKVRGAEILFTDDTPVTIASPEDRSTGSKKGRIWIYLDREGNHAYDFTDTRKKDGPAEWLGAFKGFVHADAYPAYDQFFGPGAATEVACWAHTRRKFVDAEGTEPNLAAEILSRIRELYKVERFAKDGELDGEARGRLRQEKALPILTDLRAQLVLLETQVLPQGPMGKAIAYALRQWDALTTYTSDGRLSIDNNAAERALRSIAVGRKNWMFFQRESGGRTAAVLFSLLKTAEAAGIDPLIYFRDVLVRIDRERDTAKLLPFAWKQHFAGEVAKQRQAAVEIINRG